MYDLIKAQLSCTLSLYLESVTNTSKLLPTHSVSKIHHQNGCSNSGSFFTAQLIQVSSECRFTSHSASRLITKQVKFQQNPDIFILIRRKDSKQSFEIMNFFIGSRKGGAMRCRTKSFEQDQD